jgi:hypothetical protein
MGKTGESTPSGLALFLETNFYEKADTLRKQFEERLSTSVRENDGMTPLVYAFSNDKFQFLTASADRFFTREVVEDFIEKLREWAKARFGTQNVSTPQTRVYVNGCWRSLLLDGVSAKWHYMLSITRHGGRGGIGLVKVLTNTVRRDGNGQFSADRLVSSRLSFNQLLVHATENAYAIEMGKTSMNPLQGTVFLDGYLW